MTNEEIKKEVAIERLIVLESEISNLIETEMMSWPEQLMAQAIIDLARFTRERAQPKASDGNG